MILSLFQRLPFNFPSLILHSIPNCSPHSRFSGYSLNTPGTFTLLPIFYLEYSSWYLLLTPSIQLKSSNLYKFQEYPHMYFTQWKNSSFSPIRLHDTLCHYCSFYHTSLCLYSSELQCEFSVRNTVLSNFISQIFSRVTYIKRCLINIYWIKKGKKIGNELKVGKVSKQIRKQEKCRR